MSKAITGGYFTKGIELRSIDGIKYRLNLSQKPKMSKLNFIHISAYICVYLYIRIDMAKPKILALSFLEDHKIGNMYVDLNSTTSDIFQKI